MVIWRAVSGRRGLTTGILRQGMAGAVTGATQKHRGALLRHSMMKGKTMVPKKKEDVIEIKKLNQSSMKVKIIGTSPYLYHSISDRSAYELLIPKVKSRRLIDRKLIPKHIVDEEYVNSTYRDKRMTESYLHLPARQIKAAMRQAAFDSPGTASKAGIGRLAWVDPEKAPMYGVPQLHLTTVRQSGPARTPDIRTRAILPEWCCEFVVSYFKPHLTSKVVLTLLANAGVLMGVGDWRPEKGGRMGRFTIVSTDKEQAAWDRIQSTGGREPQYASLHADCETTFPATYDDYSERLFQHYLDNRNEEEGVQFDDQAIEPFTNNDTAPDALRV
jgi:hypothetical protein